MSESGPPNDFVTSVVSLFKGRKGIEIGGPSEEFSSGLPIYPIVESLDGANFGGHTIWEGRLKAGKELYAYGQVKRGTQFIAEATHLAKVPSAAYDFVLSSNCLEHVANPLKALIEWRRVLKPGGLLLLLLPVQDNNFDHRRPITSFDHLLSDYLNSTGEDDLTHLDEILKLHDLERDKLAGSLEQFRERSLRNVENRALHHHVFDGALSTKMLSFANFEVMYNARGPLNHCTVAASRP
jgi:SAM-dependent methyltransferase